MKTLIFCIFFLGAINFGYSQEKKNPSLLEKGIKLFDQKKYNEALALYDIALSKNPDDVQVLSEKALTLNVLGKHEAVVKVCKKIFKLVKNTADYNSVYLIWGNSLDELGEQMKAVDVYDEGILRNPTYAQLYLNRGIMYTKQGKFDDALKDFEKTVSLESYHAGGHNYLGRLNYHEYPIQSLLALSRYLLIEYQGERAIQGLELVQSILKGKAYLSPLDTSQVDVVIPARLAEEMAGNKKDKNNFSQIEIQLSLLSSLAFSDEYKEKDQYQQMAMKFDHLIGQLDKYKVRKTGFYWEYYVPYFVELKKNDFLELFTHLIFLPEEEPENIKWLAEHEALLDAFYSWDKDFQWKSF